MKIRLQCVIQGVSLARVLALVLFAGNGGVVGLPADLYLRLDPWQALSCTLSAASFFLPLRQPLPRVLMPFFSCPFGKGALLLGSRLLRRFLRQRMPQTFSICRLSKVPSGRLPSCLSSGLSWQSSSACGHASGAGICVLQGHSLRFLHALSRSG